MRIVLLAIVSLQLLAACGTNCNEQLKKLYGKHQKVLSKSQVVNGFTLTMHFLPTHMLPKAGTTTEADTADFYYFRLQVQCPRGEGNSNAVSLNYGLDSLFSAADSIIVMPELVEPVITGRQQFYEYLLVFPVNAFEKGPKLKVFFLDRLFTNTRLAFEFDRTIIEEIETLPCYATKA